MSRLALHACALLSLIICASGQSTSYPLMQQLCQLGGNSELAQLACEALVQPPEAEVEAAQETQVRSARTPPTQSGALARLKLFDGDGEQLFPVKSAQHQTSDAMQSVRRLLQDSGNWQPMRGKRLFASFLRNVSPMSKK